VTEEKKKKADKKRAFEKGKAGEWYWCRLNGARKRERESTQ
jgi:hypothetical protein